MKNKRARRKRIDPSVIQGEVVVDIEAFIKNKASDNAKKIVTASEHIQIQIYFDKHYFIRFQHGDSEGKRDGIEIELVQSLIIDAAKHLLFYSIKLKNFSFVNFEINGRPQRIVLTQLFDEGSDLNIIAEYHYLSMHNYEVTLITAIRKDDFYFNDGTFQLKLASDGTSTLHKNERGKILLVGEYD